ncbi:unnamed protein product [Mytilus coruscus]|uniref:Uncharacterized protein n=1 Tax=Mytilus coruscus TaxID=42192 RepID=A0A6J8EFU4_MYTCO|nr:unnamed protein product [Mytilus coruscus]
MSDLIEFYKIKFLMEVFDWDCLGKGQTRLSGFEKNKSRFFRMNGIKSMKTTFAVCNILFFIMGIAAMCIGIYLKVSRSDFVEILQREIIRRCKERSKTRSAWDKLQEKYLCCGVNNYTDWYGVYDIHNYNTLPDSCCGYAGCGQSGGVVAYRISCYEDAKEWIIDNFT